MRHRLDRQYTMSLGFLSLVESLNLGMKPDRKVGRFDKRPGQILVAVLGIAAAFAFAVADFLTADTPAVRSKVSHARKSPDVAGLQHDRQCQDLPDPRYGLKKPELGSQFDSIPDGLLQDLRLFIGTATSPTG